MIAAKNQNELKILKRTKRKITHHMKWTMIQATQIITDLTLDTMKAKDCRKNIFLMLEKKSVNPNFITFLPVTFATQLLYLEAL